jgi:hypothetical protein
VPRLLLLAVLTLLLGVPSLASTSCPTFTRTWDGTEDPGDLARHYGIPVQTLLLANPDLKGARPPQTLHIPPPPGGWPRHVVQKGETLWGLARRYEVSLEDLRQVNLLTDDRVRTGGSLWIPRALPTPPPARWLGVTLPDGRRGWVPGEAVLLPATAPRSRSEVVVLARKLEGAPYRLGGVTPDALDCSGYIQEVFRMAGFSLPRMADQQFEATREVDLAEARPADLVFFSTDQPGPSHVGIYLGDGRFIHASSSRGVTEDVLTSDWFASRFLGVRRIVEWCEPLP